jgi:hypothetical protein
MHLEDTTMHKQMRNALLFLFGFLEILLSWRTEGGFCSSTIGFLRTMAPHSGFISAVTSSWFIALVLTTPMILDRDNTLLDTFRSQVLISHFPQLMLRENHTRLKVASVLTWIVLAVAAEGALHYLLFDPFHFHVSVYPAALYVSALMLRFVFHNLPAEEDVLKTSGEVVEEIGEVGQQALVSVPQNTIAIVLDNVDKRDEGLRILFGRHLFEKKAAMRVWMVQTDAVYAADVPKTLIIGQTELSLRVDVATTRYPEDIDLTSIQLSAGVPTKKTFEPVIKRLLETEVKPQITGNAIFQRMESLTKQYLLDGMERPGIDPTRRQLYVYNMEIIRYQRDAAATQLAAELLKAQETETYCLAGKLFHLRIYAEKICLCEQAQQEFDRIREETTLTVKEMIEARQGDVRALAVLLDAMDNPDLPYEKVLEILNRAMDPLHQNVPSVDNETPGNFPNDVNDTNNEAVTEDDSICAPQAEVCTGFGHWSNAPSPEVNVYGR